MLDYPIPDETREESLKAAVRDLAAAGIEEVLVAAMEAVRQVRIDTDRLLNAVHVPKDAGEYETALRSLLERIPDGLGRWIDCGHGWYPTGRPRGTAERA